MSPSKNIHNVYVNELFLFALALTFLLVVKPTLKTIYLAYMLMWVSP